MVAKSQLALKSRSSSTRPDFVLRIQDLRVEVSGDEEATELLQGVSAELQSGHVLAIVGGSGAGKTTLLNSVANGRHARGLSYSGSVTFNNKSLSRRGFQGIGSYVEQVDTLWPMMTVHETLRFAAGLYQGRTPASQRRAKVEETLSQLGLAACQNVIVGDGVLVRGISGGQRKRLSIAMELMKRPSLLVLDEPTSGLDSAAAEAIMRLLASYAADHNIGVLCTIHQPSSYTFKCFDQLLVLAMGRACYFGPASAALAHFASLGRTCEAGVNPAEFILRTTNPDFCQPAQVKELCDAWEGRSGEEDNEEEEDEEEEEEELSDGDDVRRGKFMFKHGKLWLPIAFEQEGAGERASWATQSLLLARRALVGHVRNPAALGGQIIFGALGVAFISFAYLQGREMRQEDVLDRVWAVMWLQGFPSFLVVGAIPSLAQEAACLRRELHNGMFGPLNHLLGDFLASFPLWFVITLASILPGFAILDMNWESLPQIWLLITAYVGMSHMAAQFYGSLFNNPALGTAAFIGQTIVNMVFNGTMLARVDSLHPLIRWIGKIVPSKYSFRSGVLLEFQGHIFTGFHTCSTLTAEQRSGMPCWGHEGVDVVRALSRAHFPVLTAEDTLLQDLGVVVAWAVFFKAAHALLLLKAQYL